MTDQSQDSPQVPVRSAHEKGKRRARSVSPSDGHSGRSTFTTPNIGQRGAHPSTRLVSVRRRTKSKVKNSAFTRRPTNEDTDGNETGDEIHDEDETQDEDELVDEDDTVDEDSDTPPSRTKSRNSRSKRTHQHQDQGLDRQIEEERAIVMRDPPATADATLASENARLRQIIATLQSTHVADRQETRTLNQTLQNLTNAVSRLTETSDQALPNQPRSIVCEKPSRVPRGGTLTVSQFMILFCATVC